MNEFYYHFETILNELPQRLIANQLQQLVFTFLSQERTNQPILEVEKYFRNLIKKIEFYYCRRLQKLDFFIQKQCDPQILLLRISKYLQKKPWRLDQMDYQQKKKSIKLDNKNCNQQIQINPNSDDFDYFSSKTSTPFSHYSVPSLQKENTLNQAIFFDLNDSNSISSGNDEETIDISKLQEDLQKQVLDNIDQKEQIQQAQLEDLNDNDLFLESEFAINTPQKQLDIDLSEIELSPNNDNLDEQFNFEDEKLEVISKITPPNSQVEPPKQVIGDLFKTHQSTKEIIKYVEQFQQELHTHQRVQSSQTRQKPKLSDIMSSLDDRIHSPSVNRKYRVRSSYQRELPQMRLKSNISHENFFEVRTAYSSKSTNKNRPQFLPSPLNDQRSAIESNRNQTNNKNQNSKLKPQQQQFRHSQQQQYQQQQQYIIQQQQSLKIQKQQTNQKALANQRLFKKFTQIKQSHSVTNKRTMKHMISYSQDKSYKIDEIIDGIKQKRTINLDYY